MRSLAALVAADARRIGRDSLLAGVALVPVAMVLTLRLLLPPLAAWLAREHQVDLAAYQPLLATVLVLLNVPVLFGLLMGFLVLEERRAGTLDALRVTPLEPQTLLVWRGLAAFALAFAYVLACLPLGGLVPLARLGSIAPAVAAAALLAPSLGLLVIALAKNELEGLAVVKATGFVVLAPALGLLVDGPWRWAFALVPTYWPARALDQALAGRAALPTALLGAAYAALLLALLWRLSARSLATPRA